MGFGEMVEGVGVCVCFLFGGFDDGLWVFGRWLGEGRWVLRGLVG